MPKKMGLMSSLAMDVEGVYCEIKKSRLYAFANQIF